MDWGNPGSFIHEMAVSKGSGSVLNGYESMVGQININLKQPENAEKLHLNFYLNQAGEASTMLFFQRNLTINGPLLYWHILKTSKGGMIEIKTDS